MTGLGAFCGSLGVLMGISYVLTQRICKLEKANEEQQRQIDDMKRELEKMKKQKEPQS